MQTGSLQIIRERLRLAASGRAPEVPGDSLAADVQELERRVHRLNQRGGALAHVRLSTDLLTWRTASEATA